MFEELPMEAGVVSTLLPGKVGSVWCSIRWVVFVGFLTTYRKNGTWRNDDVMPKVF
ncbi:hypothetical protein BDM02DRAFT_3119209 [Thelephora ganbajun]|uniref:Uncharacterized protein n=1 Tax=Thelephora ganbajun TaxID=370292 RepID=A0ACB6Z972_THEGA|nr:hypothetical protein BDM02DRAFT_3119209 [Thelephora ganbajun]